MGRLSRFARADIAGAALRLVAERGPRSVTVADVARAVGAPTGSIYHRYRSRDQLLAEMWMDVVEGFQGLLVDTLARAHDVEGAIEAARVMAVWTRAQPMQARLLLLHRRQDFVSGRWPPALARRAAALEPQIGAALRGFARRAFGRADADVLARVRYALLDAPFGGLKPYVQARVDPPPSLDELVAATVRAALATIAPAPETSGRRAP